MVKLIVAREIVPSSKFCSKLQSCGFSKVMMLRMFVISTMGGCYGVLVEMEHTHHYFLCEWDHHKVNSTRFVFLHDILLIIEQKMINKMGMDVKINPNFISYFQMGIFKK
jgi:hypothetical protein